MAEVWVAFTYTDGDGSYLHGVFSARDKALESIKEHITDEPENNIHYIARQHDTMKTLTTFYYKRKFGDTIEEEPVAEVYSMEIDQIGEYHI